MTQTGRNRLHQKLASDHRLCQAAGSAEVRAGVLLNLGHHHLLPRTSDVQNPTLELVHFTLNFLPPFHVLLLAVVRSVLGNQLERDACVDSRLEQIPFVLSLVYFVRRFLFLTWGNLNPFAWANANCHRLHEIRRGPENDSKVWQIPWSLQLRQHVQNGIPRIIPLLEKLIDIVSHGLRHESDGFFGYHRTVQGSRGGAQLSDGIITYGRTPEALMLVVCFPHSIARSPWGWHGSRVDVFLLDGLHQPLEGAHRHHFGPKPCHPAFLHNRDGGCCSERVKVLLIWVEEALQLFSEFIALILVIVVAEQERHQCIGLTFVSWKGKRLHL
mmetsp:Transcript_28302/g.44138  ORF Transcript_28302/g.44138 Transcript_28302/m.44138 type:complete len:328 (+) Transcript_28302:1104-2087(+)